MDSGLAEGHYQYSETFALNFLTREEKRLLIALDEYKKQLNFPAIRNDIGAYLNFLVKSFGLKNIFEFGSGYGHSAFWYFVGDQKVEQLFLTEKRTDLKDIFHALMWPKHWKETITYYQGDAFDLLKQVSNLDLVLIDGQKADYLKFYQAVKPKMRAGGFVVIDNAFWQGSLVQNGLVSETSQTAIRALHEYLKQEQVHSMQYLPFRDGLLLIQI